MCVLDDGQRDEGCVTGGPLISSTAVRGTHTHTHTQRIGL